MFGLSREVAGAPPAMGSGAFLFAQLHLALPVWLVCFLRQVREPKLLFYGPEVDLLGKLAQGKQGDIAQPDR
jgi:hypothetical protein